MRAALGWLERVIGGLNMKNFNHDLVQRHKKLFLCLGGVILFALDVADKMLDLALKALELYAQLNMVLIYKNKNEQPKIQRL